MTALRKIIFTCLMLWQFGYIWSEAPVVNFALRVDWIEERAYLRGEGLLGTFYRPVRWLYRTELRESLLAWDRKWYRVWFGK